MTSSQTSDRKLIRALTEHAANTYPDWSYSGDAERRAAHGLIQYPAMMVPSMQRDLLSTLISVAPKSEIVLDPFVGSGTALTETLAAGRSFVGYDINPLAILIARVKAQPGYAESYANAADDVLSSISRDKRTDYAVHFPNQEKWFRRSNSIGLSRIRRAVERLSNQRCRRFMWVALAETVRRCSNSRTSTYKLHVRAADKISTLDGAALTVFRSVLKANVERMLAEKSRLQTLNLLTKNKTKNDVVLWLADVCQLKKNQQTKNVDIVLTSPPYGDNRTTVPYGQFSYLALRWIPHCDLDAATNKNDLNTTHTLDTASIGGGMKTSSAIIDELTDMSPSFFSMHRNLKSIDPEAARRWAAYCRDLSSSLRSIVATVRPGGYLVWTIGQRRIRSMNAPLMKVLNELHQANNASAVTSIRRKIPTKRMPTRNSIGSLMQTEHICFYRKR